jgi:Spy/CpxP family protein refolding chaperone
MKTTKLRLLSLAAACAAGFLSNSLIAQTQPGAPERPAVARAAGAGALPGGRFGPGADRIVSVLTDEQRASMREFMAGQAATTRDLERKLRDARKELFEAALDQKFDEAVVREKAMAVAKLDAELTVLRTKAIAMVKPPLSAEQIEKIKSFGPASGQPEAGAAPQRPRRPNIPRDDNDLPVRPAPPAQDGAAKPEKP